MTNGFLKSWKKIKNFMHKKFYGIEKYGGNIDHALFLAACVHVLFKYSANSWLSILAFYIVFYWNYKESLSAYESFYISISARCVEAYVLENKGTFTMSHLIIFNEKSEIAGFLHAFSNIILFSELNICKEISEYVMKIKNNLQIFVYLAFQVIICFITQLLLFKFTQINTKRKVFHFFIFFCFFKRTDFLIHTGQFLLFLFCLLQNSTKLASLYQEFRSRKDRSGKKICSHMILLGSVLYSAIIFKKDVDYHSVLISICFLDSFASITGKFFRTEDKSLIGLLGGFFAGNITYFTIYGNFLRWKYFMLMSIMEYLISSNDNIVLPFFSAYILGNCHSFN